MEQFLVRVVVGGGFSEQVSGAFDDLFDDFNGVGTLVGLHFLAGWLVLEFLSFGRCRKAQCAKDKAEGEQPNVSMFFGVSLKIFYLQRRTIPHFNL